MAKNKIALTVQVRDDNYLPTRDRVIAWLGEQYDQAVDLARQNRDGSVSTVRAEFPCAEIPKDA